MSQTRTAIAAKTGLAARIGRVLNTAHAINSPWSFLARLAVLLPLLITFLLVHPAYGKAYFAARKEMVDRADIIALVDLGAVEKCLEKGQYFEYQEKACAKVEKLYKGKLPNSITIYGAETFRCAQMRLVPGRAIVFLKKDTPQYHGSNWHLSLNHISGDKINWPAKDDERQQRETSFSEAEKQLTKDLSQTEVQLLDKIKGAKYFCSGAMGEGGNIPDEYKAYQTIMKNAEVNRGSANSGELIEIVRSQKSTAAGKFYAISILSKIDDKLAKSLLLDLAANISKEKVRFYSGCERSEDTVADIAKALLKKGLYIDFKLGAAP